MNIIFTMIISSNTLFIIFMILDYYNKNLFSQYQRYTILKIALFMMLIPLGYIKVVIALLFQYFLDCQEIELLIKGNAPIIMITPEGSRFNSSYGINMIVTYLWIGITFISLSYHIWKHRRFRKFILHINHETFSPELLNIVEKYRNQLHIKRSIRVYLSDINISPFTIGIYKPIIVMPRLKDTFKHELIIKHELYHIRRYDILVKLFRTIAIGIYWFNPLVYKLDSYLDESCEFACDEAITQSLSRENKRKYGHLIIDMAALNPIGPMNYINSFSNNKKKIKERINLIMKEQRKKNRLAILLSIVAVACSSFTVFAYDKPHTMTWAEQPSDDVFLTDSNQMVMFSSNLQPENSKNLQITYNSQFVDIYGNTYRIDDRPLTRKKCTHTFVDGKYSKHTKNKNGSCLTKTYSAQRCSKCGSMKLGSLESEAKYTKCPH